ncbi:hypothetical protein LINPERHAP2_LOCUS15616 [Linum perenne]
MLLSLLEPTSYFKEIGRSTFFHL